ncbi:efflux RND transporter periplasmic adaptor subunit [Polaribacter sp. IC073]|uniref:efflux RND transporter periplasmic adaptor subunit n=1 Tax=Polaribacter sp. IC073 TaxID=2508540 RepID=UPI0011BEBE6B|nr:efflux RND transporter periplasmic adaptor subunit [Polaribacter sp. IC073]TXD48646.1 HlyD family efflux transporter periplasmic adaptor subunit [Polaribacter sp. IC073]
MKFLFLFALIICSACQTKQDTISPVKQSITESVYASGLIVSKKQYQVFATVSGLVDEVFADEGVTVEIGSPIVSIINDAQRLMLDNAKLSANFNAYNVNRGKLEEAKSFVDLAKSQMENDAIMLERQKRLWAQKIGSKVLLEQKELAVKKSKNTYESTKEKLAEVERQLGYLSKQAKNKLLISDKNTSDYLVRSKIKGKVYQMNISKGEIVTPQIPIAIIGDDKKYLLEMQIDEYDIVDIQVGMPILVVLNSYRDSVFNAVVSKINPIMNLKSKTFTIEAEFLRPPNLLYPNISFEANVVIKTKIEALLIPRNYLLNDSIVVNKSGKIFIVKTGLKDYQMVEIISGIDENEELILPE